MQQVITYLGKIIVKRALVLSEAHIVMMLTQKALSQVAKGYCDFIPVDLFILSIVVISKYITLKMRVVMYKCKDICMYVTFQHNTLKSWKSSLYFR